MGFTNPRNNAMSGLTSAASSQSGPSSKHQKRNFGGSAWLEKLHGRFKNRDVPDTVPPFSTPCSTSPHPNSRRQQSEEHQGTDIKKTPGLEESGASIVNAISPSPKLKLAAVVQWIKARQAYLRTAEKDIYDQARIIIANRRISKFRGTPAEKETQTDTDGCLDIRLPTNTSDRQAEHSPDTSTEGHSRLSEGPRGLSSSIRQPNRLSIRLVPEEHTENGDDAGLDCNDAENGLGSLPSPSIAESDDSEDTAEVIHVFSARPPSFITNRHCLPRFEREGAPSPDERLRNLDVVEPPLTLFSKHSK